MNQPVRPKKALDWNTSLKQKLFDTRVLVQNGYLGVYRELYSTGHGLFVVSKFFCFGLGCSVLGLQRCATCLRLPAMTRMTRTLAMHRTWMQSEMLQSSLQSERKPKTLSPVPKAKH